MKSQLKLLLGQITVCLVLILFFVAQLLYLYFYMWLNVRVGSEFQSSPFPPLSPFPSPLSLPPVLLTNYTRTMYVYVRRIFNHIWSIDDHICTIYVACMIFSVHA